MLQHLSAISEGWSFKRESRVWWNNSYLPRYDVTWVFFILFFLFWHRLYDTVCQCVNCSTKSPALWVKFSLPSKLVNSSFLTEMHQIKCHKLLCFVMCKKLPTWQDCPWQWYLMIQFVPLLLAVSFNSLAPGKFEWNFIYVIFTWILMIDGRGISCEIALIWLSLDFTDDQSTLVQVMAWCRQATSHYLSPCWPRSLSPYGVTRPEWVKVDHWWNLEIQHSFTPSHWSVFF